MAGLSSVLNLYCMHVPSVGAGHQADKPGKTYASYLPKNKVRWDHSVFAQDLQSDKAERMDRSPTFYETLQNATGGDPILGSPVAPVEYWDKNTWELLMYNQLMFPEQTGNSPLKEVLLESRS